MAFFICFIMEIIDFILVEFGFKMLSGPFLSFLGGLFLFLLDKLSNRLFLWFADFLTYKHLIASSNIADYLFIVGMAQPFVHSIFDRGICLLCDLGDLFPDLLLDLLSKTLRSLEIVLIGLYYQDVLIKNDYLFLLVYVISLFMFEEVLHDLVCLCVDIFEKPDGLIFLLTFFVHNMMRLKLQSKLSSQLFIQNQTQLSIKYPMKKISLRKLVPINKNKYKHISEASIRSSKKHKEVKQKKPPRIIAARQNPTYVQSVDNTRHKRQKILKKNKFLKSLLSKEQTFKQSLLEDNVSATGQNDLTHFPLGVNPLDQIAVNIKILQHEQCSKDVQKYLPKQRFSSKGSQRQEQDAHNKHKIIVAKTFCDPDHYLRYQINQIAVHNKKYKQKDKQMIDKSQIDPQQIRLQFEKVKTLIKNKFGTTTNLYRILLVELDRLGLKMNITQLQYRQYLESIVLEAFVQLQKFIYFECNCRITPIPRQEIRKIKGVVFNCRETCSEEQYSTLFALIKILYGISDGLIWKSSAIKLYKKLILSLEYLYKYKIDKDQKILKMMKISNQTAPSRSTKDKEKTDTQKLNQIWNSTYEKQLIESFKYYQNFGLIRNHFKAMYPQQEAYFTRLNLLYKIHNILKTALKKVRFLVDYVYTGTLRLRDFDDGIIKKVLRNTPGNRLRLELIEVYAQENMPFEKVYELVDALNVFIQTDGDAVFGVRLSECGKGYANQYQVKPSFQKRLNRRLLFKSQRQGIDNIRRIISIDQTNSNNNKRKDNHQNGQLAMFNQSIDSESLQKQPQFYQPYRKIGQEMKKEATDQTQEKGYNNECYQYEFEQEEEGEQGLQDRNESMGNGLYLVSDGQSYEQLFEYKDNRSNSGQMHEMTFPNAQQLQNMLPPAIKNQN